jgi:hypothetical protein
MRPDARALWLALRGAVTPAPETSEDGWATAAALQGALLARGRARLPPLRAFCLACALHRVHS